MRGREPPEEAIKTRKRLEKELDASSNAHQTIHVGQTASCIHEWKKLTSDHTILQMVKGDIIEFEDKIPLKHLANNPNLLIKKSF